MNLLNTNISKPGKWSAVPEANEKEGERSQFNSTYSELFKKKIVDPFNLTNRKE